ncbi:hypothetical protein CC2G_013916 [Coprinopsis cinerea AmutBmut pab1-1]|nr:hypothetical protein CC2G_013916 [Coprinopsis cinerea AmutBmut pab1-1]
MQRGSGVQGDWNDDLGGRFETQALWMRISKYNKNGPPLKHSAKVSLPSCFGSSKNYHPLKAPRCILEAGGFSTLSTFTSKDCRLGLDQTEVICLFLGLRRFTP